MFDWVLNTTKTLWICRGEVSQIDQSYLSATPNFTGVNRIEIKLVESLIIK